MEDENVADLPVEEFQGHAATLPRAAAHVKLPRCGGPRRG
jgi:hypothetical protein